MTTTAPQHIAFIMDGNRRWGVEQGMNKIYGHQHGADNMHTILGHCKTLGTQSVSVYAFSSENWERNPLEVAALTKLIRTILVRDRQKLLDHEVRIRFVGDVARFDEDIQQSMQEIEQATAHHPQALFICVSYGGRAEMVQAAERLSQSGESITEESLKKHMWSHDMDDIDLLIRTGGHHRLSNFLPWQAAYAEMVFTDTYWPGFTTDELDTIIAEYQQNVVVNKGK